MTFLRLKIIIEKGAYEKERILSYMDVFLLSGRISNEEYTELYNLINGVE